MKEASPLQEADVVARAPVRNVAFATLVVLGASLAAVVWLMGGLERGRGQAPPAAPTTIGTLEQTLILAGDRGTRERAANLEKLEALEWVDRDAGIARIPIGRAIDLVVADGGAP